MESVFQISNMHKIRTLSDICEDALISDATLLPGEAFYWQIVLTSKKDANFSIKLDSPLKKYITVYQVGNVIMDRPSFDFASCDNYLTKEPGFMPDVLAPFDIDRDWIRVDADTTALWIKLNLPKDTARMAIVVITTLPIIFAYPFFQKYFVSGLTVGAVIE